MMPSKQWVARSSRARDAIESNRGNCFSDKKPDFYHLLQAQHNLSCQRREYELSTLSQALTAYRIFAKAEGKSPRTVEWITSSVQHFIEFLGGDPTLGDIGADELRGFILPDTHLLAN